METEEGCPDAGNPRPYTGTCRDVVWRPRTGARCHYSRVRGAALALPALWPHLPCGPTLWPHLPSKYHAKYKNVAMLARGYYTSESWPSRFVNTTPLEILRQIGRGEARHIALSLIENEISRQFEHFTDLENGANSENGLFKYILIVRLVVNKRSM